MQYEMIDKNIAQSATHALNRHLWYLTAEMVPLALFSHHVPETERKALAESTSLVPYSRNGSTRAV